MCMLTFYRPGVVPNLDHLATGAKCNTDGHGFAVIVGDRIETGKGMNPTAVIEAFDSVRARHPESYALFHSRITTDGLTNEDNCHPFVVGGDPRTVLAHNGILPALARPGKGDNRSDTRILAEDLIPAGNFGHLSTRRARRRLVRWMGSERYGNKVAILTTDPSYGKRAYLLNEQLGEWSEGIWYSNSGYLPYTYRASSWSSSYGYGGAFGDGYDWSEDDKRWQQYRRGEMTYNEYLSAADNDWRPSTGTTGTGWPRGNDYGDCPLCQSIQAVNQVVGYCTACLHCVDCREATTDCQCYVGSHGDSKPADHTWRDLSTGAPTAGPVTTLGPVGSEMTGDRVCCSLWTGIYGCSTHNRAPRAITSGPAI